MRVVRCVLAGWYLLASTNLPAFALDQCIPQTKTIASADFPCAHHDCGCKTAEQCRLRCCCHPKPSVQQPVQQLCHLPHHQPRTIRISYLSALDCEGGQTHPEALAAHKMDPHLPPSILTTWVSALARWETDQSEDLLTSPFLEAPDKVPIQAPS